MEAAGLRCKGMEERPVHGRRNPAGRGGSCDHGIQTCAGVVSNGRTSGYPGKVRRIQSPECLGDGDPGSGASERHSEN